MRLCNVNLIGTNEPLDILVDHGIIKSILSGGNKVRDEQTERRIEFTNAIAFPGLINSHDHLDFNSFPLTGNRIYPDYSVWGKDIHQQNKESIREVLQIPQRLRIQWGIYKNLLNGVTTVVNHGEKLATTNDLITVLQRNHSLHSVQFEKRWKLKLNRIFSGKQPYVIHLGEGSNPSSHAEITQLIKWNLFKKKILAVHGVAMDVTQAKAFQALVWCPASNFFLLGVTADIGNLKKVTPILFGTDSTLTAGWNIWDHFRLAIKTKMMTGPELFDTLSQTAATVWELNSGAIAADKEADLVIAEAGIEEGYNRFYALNPERILLILHHGEIRLFDPAISNQLPFNPSFRRSFYRISINGKEKYVYGDLPALITEIKSYHPGGDIPITV